jgi:hypothetical protein
MRASLLRAGMRGNGVSIEEIRNNGITCMEAYIMERESNNKIASSKARVHAISGDARNSMDLTDLAANITANVKKMQIDHNKFLQQQQRHEAAVMNIVQQQLANAHTVGHCGSELGHGWDGLSGVQAEG